MRAFMTRLADYASTEGRVYFTGGVTALLMEWRSSTIDIDRDARSSAD